MTKNCRLVINTHKYKRHYCLNDLQIGEELSKNSPQIRTIIMVVLLNLAYVQEPIHELQGKYLGKRSTYFYTQVVMICKNLSRILSQNI